jgi:DNA-binding HxlR family transcriptional regulator
MNADPKFAPNVLAAECPSRQVLKHLTSQWGVLVLLALRDGYRPEAICIGVPIDTP